MFSQFIRWLLIAMLAGQSLWACRSSSTLQVHTLSNYAPDKPLIVFLDFKFQATNRADKPEVSLVNAIAGRGQVKEVEPFSHSQQQIEVVFRDANRQPLRTILFDNPLNPVIEYPTDNQSLQLTSVQRPEANLSFRFNLKPAIVALDLYSVVRENRSKIYTLQLKP